MFSRFIILLAALFMVPLAACAPLTSALGSPSSIANQTKADEQAALTANLAYKAWEKAAEVGINAGLIKGSVATKVAALDNRLYAALQAVDAAYASGNSASVIPAIANFNTILSSANAAIGSK